MRALSRVLFVMFILAFGYAVLNERLLGQAGTLAGLCAAGFLLFLSYLTEKAAKRNAWVDSQIAEQKRKEFAESDAKIRQEQERRGK